MRSLLAALLMIASTPEVAHGLDLVEHIRAEATVSRESSDRGERNGPASSSGVPHVCCCCSSHLVAPCQGTVDVQRSGEASVAGFANTHAPPATRDPSRPFRPPIA